ncbi:hypothetical protein JQM84_07830 [Parabacteroides distasonis]|nr:hypothetical protein [Parabacteroides distasonis]
MNKKFFTLMAAALLGGAAMPSEAFAQASTPAAPVHKAGIADTTEVKSDLMDGLKFMLRSHNNIATGADGGGIAFISVADSAKTSFKVYSDSVKPVAQKPAVFEVRNWNKSSGTFELYVDGKQFVKGIGGKHYGTFMAYSKNKVATSAGQWDSLKVVTGPLALDTVFTQAGKTTGASIESNIIHTYTTKTTQAAENLNAYFNGSFKLGFPDAETAPAVNPFGEDLVAIPASVLNYVLTNGVGTNATFSKDSVFMAKKTDDAVKIGAGSETSVAKIKALELVVIDPTKSFGLTGFDGTAGEGYMFTTIKAEDLSATENELNEDGTLKKVYYMNGLFKVNEADGLNAAGKLSLVAGKFQYFDKNKKSTAIYAEDSDGYQADSVLIAAYTPTKDGAAYYVTTVHAEAEEGIALAEMGGTSYVNTKALLSEDGPTIYNIQFLGTKPTSGSNWYGKYLVCVPANSNEGGTYGAAAPADVDLTNADAQWIVKEVGSAGKLTLISARDYKTEAKLSLYEADGGLYTLNGGFDGKDGTEKVKLTTAEESAAYVKLTDTEKTQNMQIYFQGKDAIGKEKVYVAWNKDRKQFVGTQESADAENFKHAGDTTVVEKYTYAYLKKGEVADKEVEVKIPAYRFKWNDKFVHFKEESKLDTCAMDDTHKANGNAIWFAFKKNYDGTTNALVFKSKDGKANKDSLVNGQKAQRLYVKTLDATLDSTLISTANSYVDVVLSFYSLGETLPQEVGRATFESNLGGIAMRENENGIVDAIIADEPATFWLDTADTKADFPTFYIRSSVSAEDLRADEEAAPVKRFMLYTPTALANYWDDAKAEWVKDNDYYAYDDLKAVFVPAAVVGVNEVVADINGKETTLKKDGTKVFKFHITEADDEGGYYISSDKTGNYLRNANGVLVFTSDKNKALVVSVNEGDPTANEAIEAAGVQVIGGQGAVTVQGAAGKVITVANILGQTIANQVAASDNVTIAVPAGIVVVAVEGEATKVVVK